MSKHQLVLIFICFIAFISLGLPDGLLGVSWPYIHRDYDVSLDSLGLLLLVFTAGYLTASINSGYVISRMKLGALLSLSCAITGLSLLGYASTGYWWVLLVMGFFLGMGGGTIDASINTFAASNFSTGVVNWLHAFYGIGATLGPLITTFYLINKFSWVYGYITVAIVQISLSIIFLLTLKQWKNEKKQEELASSAKGRETLSKGSTWLSIFIFFIYTGTEISVGQWIFTILTKSRFINEATAGFWTSAYWGSLTAGRIIFGFIMARFSVAKVLTARLAGVVIGTGLIAIKISEFGTLAGIIIIGMSVAPIFPSLISMTPQRLGLKHAANAIGYQISAAMLGGALLPGFAGWMTDYFSIEVINIIHFIEALILLGLYLVISKKYPVKG